MKIYIYQFTFLASIISLVTSLPLEKISPLTIFAFKLLILLISISLTFKGSP